MRPLQRQGGLLLLFLSILGSTVLLYTLPMVWVGRRLSQLTAEFQDTHWQQFQDVYRHWVRYDPPPAFSSGAEPALREWLVSHPLLLAVVTRDGTVWMRKDGRLSPDRTGTEARVIREWVDDARKAGRLLFPPPPALNPDHPRAPALILLGENVALIKRWEVGSPEVEAELRMVQKGRRPLKIGLRRINPGERPEGPPASWSQAPSLQADFPRHERSPWELVGNDESFGEGWELAALPHEADLARLQALIARERLVAWTVYGILVVAFSGGLWLRHRTRKRERVDADRMASMAHSLKTPLAVLKLRCDSIRLGGLPPEKVDAHLLRIGEEVESFVQIIESSLQANRRVVSASPKSPIDGAFYESVKEDLVEAFELEGRELRLRFDGSPHSTSLPALRAALVTLLENSLLHGAGRTALDIQRRGRAMWISVRDEGPGLVPLQIQSLGKPFMRFRKEGAQGFLHEGQGLGLSLLVQSAQREGWGFEIASERDRGFEAILTIPA